MAYDASAKAKLGVRITEREALKREVSNLRKQLGEKSERLAFIDSDIIALEKALAGEKRGMTDERLRDTCHRLRSFSVDEFAADQEMSKATAKKKIDAALSAGYIKEGARAFGKRTYEWVKPAEAGAAFEHQQALRVIEGGAELQKGYGGDTAVAGTGHQGVTVGSITSKEVREAVNEAVRAGWDLSRKGDGHFLLTKNGKRIGVAGTPRNPGGAADLIRRALRRAAS